MSMIDYSELSIRARLAAFDAIELAEPEIAVPSFSTLNTRYDDEGDYVPAEGDKHASTSGSSLMTFEEDMSQQNVFDVETCTYFAQRAASKKFDKKAQIVKWYEEYTHVLGVIGWNLRSYQFQEMKTNNTSVSIDQMAVRLMAGAAAGGGGIVASLLASFKESLNALAQKDQPLKAFDRHTSTDRNGGFQMMPCGETKAGLVKALLNCNYYEAKINKGKVLFVSWNKSDLRLYGSAQLSTMNPTVFANFRDEIETRLGERRREDFEKIEI
ncbi:hypothetical protein RAM80_15030 [Pseudomonas sp. App30]|uniref:hypothetical protein n=1 Tax=Pseudomonas sp. App30 TaxID=3068990 RepID=UPI003A8106E3